MIGFAAASKYVPVILALPYALAHVATTNLRAGVARLARSPGFLAGLVALIVAFLIASPFTVIDWKTTRADLSVQQERHVSDWTGMSKYPIALPTYMLETLPQTLGWPLYLLSVVGLVLMFRQGGRAAVIASVPVVYVLANGALSVAQPRFILPAMGVLSVAASLAMRQGGALAAKLLPWRFSERGAVAALVAVSLIGPGMELTAARRESALPDARHEARGWIARNIERSVPLAIDGYGPAFNTNRIERLAVDWPFYASEPELVAEAYDPIWLDGFAYYVTSSGVTRRFVSDPGKYRRENAFYAWMITRTLVVWGSDPARQSGPHVEVRRLPPRISSQAERDSAWAVRGESGKNTERLAQWCLRSGALFYFKGEFARAEEWGKRGLTIQTPSTRRDLLSLIMVAESGLDQPERVIETAHAALKAYPADAEFHMFLGAALQRLGRGAEAVVEYEASLRLDPRQPDAQRLTAEIARLTESRP
jgi:tetratricopeptide (TPR) repeat protein